MTIFEKKFFCVFYVVFRKRIFAIAEAFEALDKVRTRVAFDVGRGNLTVPAAVMIAVT